MQVLLSIEKKKKRKERKVPITLGLLVVSQGIFFLGKLLKIPNIYIPGKLLKIPNIYKIFAKSKVVSFFIFAFSFFFILKIIIWIFKEYKILSYLFKRFSPFLKFIFCQNIKWLSHFKKNKLIVTINLQIKSIIFWSFNINYFL